MSGDVKVIKEIVLATELQSVAYADGILIRNW